MSAVQQALLGYGSAAAVGPHVYWRVRRNDNGYTSCKEIEFRTVATGATGISATNTGGTAFALNNYAGLPASGAFNGSFAAPRYATALNGEFGVGYQFASAVTIVEVAIGDGGSGQDLGASVGAPISIQHSDDGTSWTTARTITSIAAWTVDSFQCFSVP